ncbi:MAG: GIY-YIG nuclease family protein [bacterium]
MYYYVYILKSRYHNKSYVGYTENVQKRLEEHNQGKNAYTKKYKPWILIHREEYGNKENAITREKYYKTHSGRNRLKKIFDDYQKRQLSNN